VDDPKGYWFSYDANGSKKGTSLIVLPLCGPAGVPPRERQAEALCRPPNPGRLAPRTRIALAVRGMHARLPDHGRRVDYQSCPLFIPAVGETRGNPCVSSPQ
jgi:hypothetical protein